MKLADLELIEFLGPKNLVPNKTLFDCAKMFNSNPMSGQQWKLSDLCLQKLNLNFKKSSSSISFAVSILIFMNFKKAIEAKICMALYHIKR
jgi:hypothetical protein